MNQLELLSVLISWYQSLPSDFSSSFLKKLLLLKGRILSKVKRIVYLMLNNFLEESLSIISMMCICWDSFCPGILCLVLPMHSGVLHRTLQVPQEEKLSIGITVSSGFLWLLPPVASRSSFPHFEVFSLQFQIAFLQITTAGGVGNSVVKESLPSVRSWFLFPALKRNR